MRNRINRLGSLFIIVVAMLVLTGAAIAQEPEMTTPLDLARAPLVLDFSVSAAGPPSIEPVSDGRMVFKINAEGPVSGGLAGTIRSAVTEMNADSSIYKSVSVTFTVETEDGTFEGFYMGAIHHPQDAPNANMYGHGYILSVSGAFADLHLADVQVVSEVHFEDGRSTGDSGTITITPR